MVVDGINVNEIHFGAMKKADAVSSMLSDGFVPGKTEKEKKAWATKVYEMINPDEKQSPEEE